MKLDWEVGNIQCDESGRYEYVPILCPDSQYPGMIAEVAAVWKIWNETPEDTVIRARLIAAAPALWDALRAVMAIGQWRLCESVFADDVLIGCGKCPGCLAWQAAHDALAALDGEQEVGDGK
jgi:hypothetical protein